MLKVLQGWPWAQVYSVPVESLVHVHYGRTCDPRNGDPVFVSQYPAVVNPPFTFHRPSRYLRPITFWKVQNVRIALQGFSVPVRT